jgi:radical SAM protein with 4Fe4S-binding SPASM domain
MQTSTGLLRPLGLICETVNICNSDCVFCPYGLQSRQFGTMDPDLFVEVCRQYAAMVGGPMSLTPVVGDFLLDRELPSRVEMLSRYRHAFQPSVTTNLYALDRHSDEVIGRLLEVFHRVHISIYGITAEENETITRRKHFNKLPQQARRLAKLWERSSGRCDIVVSFRNLYQHSMDVLRQYAAENFGHAEWFWGGATARYFNWGGTLSGALPGDARFVPAWENRQTCTMLPFALQVYWDGRVSACSCCDYDAGRDLALGDVRETTLTEMYNSKANRQIWADQELGRMQTICQNCTFHIPLSRFLEAPPIGKAWTDLAGG